MLFLSFLNGYVNKIHWLCCSASLKAQKTLFSFKEKAQEPTFQTKYQQKEIVMLSIYVVVCPKFIPKK